MSRAAGRGKVALVTGSGRGIGRETAALLLSRGYAVMLNGRDAEALERARAALASGGGAVDAAPGDVADPQACREVLGQAMRRFGRLDVLINNAGVSCRGRFAELHPEVIRRVIGTNLLGALYMSRAAMEEIARRRGSILFVSSLAGLHGLPGVSVYSVAKGALTPLAQSLRAELAGSGVHVGVVYVGFTENDRDKRVLAADGSPVALSRPYHHTRAQAAAGIVGALEARRFTVALTVQGKAFRLLDRLAAPLVQRLLAAAERRAGRFYS